MTHPWKGFSKQDAEQGFTLIELLVVILIIGILAAIAIPMFLNQRKTAVEATVKSDLKNASTEVFGKINKDGTYPTALPDTVVKSPGVTLTYSTNGKSYCIKGEHKDMKSVIYYDSVLDGITEKSCSLSLDAEGQFFTASPAGEIIYKDLATWLPNGTGPSGEVVMQLKRNPTNTDPGWGAYGLYKLDNGAIPAGSKVRISYYIRTTGTNSAASYALQIISGNASEIVASKNMPASPVWKRVSQDFTTWIDWKPNVHNLRWGMGWFDSLEISDVQIDIVSSGAVTP